MEYNLTVLHYKWLCRSLETQASYRVNGKVKFEKKDYGTRQYNVLLKSLVSELDCWSSNPSSDTWDLNTHGQVSLLLCAHFSHLGHRIVGKISKYVLQM